MQGRFQYVPDRAFLDNVVTSTLVFEGDGEVREYVGGYQDWLRQRRPERLIENAVRGMLPKNRLGRQLYRKLKVYAGPEHKHAAQQPRPLEL